MESSICSSARAAGLLRVVASSWLLLPSLEPRFLGEESFGELVKLHVEVR